MVLQEPGRVKQLVACCTNYYLRYLFIYFFSPNVSIPATLICNCSWVCFVCGYLVRVLTVLLLRGTFTPSLDGHEFFSVLPLMLPSTVWWRKSFWSLKRNAETSTHLKVACLHTHWQLKKHACMPYIVTLKHVSQHFCVQVTAVT